MTGVFCALPPSLYRPLAKTLALLFLSGLSMSLEAGLDARALWSEGRREEAVCERQRELAARPMEQDLRLECARWQITVHRPQAALQTLAPLGSIADALRGEAHYRLSQYEPAAVLLDASTPEGLLQKLDALEALMRFEDCDALLRSAPKALWQSDARVWSCEGRRRLRVREPKEAVKAFERALELDVVDGEALFGLGRAQLAVGERAAGLATLQRHRELLPKLDQWDFARRAVDLAPRHAANLAALADAERELGRIERASALYEEALACASTAEVRVPILLRCSRLWSETRQDPARAHALLIEALRTMPDARLWVRAGDLAAQMDQREEALRCLREAARLRPDDAAIAQRLARLEGRK
jgi:tetratricopeptide (TPR) repeat protein